MATKIVEKLVSGKTLGNIAQKGGTISSGNGNYSQTGGPYHQTGGGTHSQGGSDGYTQTKDLTGQGALINPGNFKDMKSGKTKGGL